MTFFCRWRGRQPVKIAAPAVRDRPATPPFEVPVEEVAVHPVGRTSALVTLDRALAHHAPEASRQETRRGSITHALLPAFCGPLAYGLRIGLRFTLC